MQVKMGRIIATMLVALLVQYAASNQVTSFCDSVDAAFCGTTKHLADIKAVLNQKEAMTDTMTMTASGVSNAYLQLARQLTQKGYAASSLLTANRIIDYLRQNAAGRADSLALAKAYTLNGQNYHSLGNGEQSLHYYRMAEQIARKLNDKRLLARIYNNIFGIYYTSHEYSHAETLVNQALEINLENKDSTDVCNNYNNLGLLCYERGDYQRALTYMEKALEYTDGDDFLSRSLVHTNMGEVYFVQDMFEKTEAELTLAMALQRRVGFDLRMIHTDLNMALVKAKLGKRGEAMEIMRKTERRLQSQPRYMEIGDAYRQLAAVYFEMGDSIAGLRKLLKSEAFTDSLTKNNSNAQLQQLLVAYDAERLQQSNARLQQSLEIYRLMVSNRTLTIYGGVLLAAILAVFIVILIRRMKADRRKNRLIMEQRERLAAYEREENERKRQELSLELDRKNRQLTTYTIDLAANNEFHGKIAAQLEAVLGAPDTGKEVAKTLRQVIHDLAHYNDKPIGEDFRTYFDEVHPEFLKNLAMRYPQLSKNDLRLCAYLHLGMTTKEIAALTYREVRSVESSRNRLRKKLELTADISLHAFLRSME